MGLLVLISICCLVFNIIISFFFCSRIKNLLKRGCCGNILRWWGILKITSVMYNGLLRVIDLQKCDAYNNTLLNGWCVSRNIFLKLEYMDQVKCKIGCLNILMHSFLKAVVILAFLWICVLLNVTKCIEIASEMTVLPT